ncbi:MAG TPA: sigma-70 family RNA polymerase sigma factor [Xanthobacteraceae bacterium]|nr:sigma-70 family RNA polymerase sigma factor [Xanthobacteraceae bacterium]
MKPAGPSPTSRFDVIGQLSSLRRYARSLTRNEADAEDLVQDALVRAYERRASFQPGRSLRAWLIAIVHNAFVDAHRARRTSAARDALAGALADDAVEAAQDHHVRLAQVRAAFMELPEEQRAALHLVAVEGLSYAEAATALGIPQGTLMSRLARARAALRALEDGVPAEVRPPPARASHLKIVGGADEPR